MTLAEVRRLLLERAAKYRSGRGTGLNAWCAKHGVSDTHASEFVHGKRPPSPQLLDALGLEWQIVRKRKARKSIAADELAGEARAEAIRSKDAGPADHRTS